MSDNLDDPSVPEGQPKDLLRTRFGSKAGAEVAGSRDPLNDAFRDLIDALDANASALADLNARTSSGARTSRPLALNARSNRV